MNAMCLFLLAAAAAASPSAGGGPGEQLAKNRRAYERQVEEINLWHAEQRKGLPDRYVAALKALEAKLQKEADLDGVLAVRTESDRFAKERQVRAGAGAALPAPLRELQLQYEASCQAAELDRARRVVEATDKYLAQLGAMQDDLTRQGAIEQAVEVRREAQRARDAADYTAAQFLIADHESKSAPKGRQPGTGEAPRRVTAGHPADAVRFSSHWYKAVLGDIGWHDAKARCEAMGGYLACITSRMENRFAMELADEKNLWIGASDEKQEGKWEWVNGEPFEYTCWGAAQPNARAPDEDYLLLKPLRFAQGMSPLLKSRITRSLDPKAILGDWHDAREDEEVRNGPPDLVEGFLCEWDR